ncbi:TPA: nicotinate-nucleotide diphosphorylase, partial [Legionella pneumophila]|nr:nicotinate-nucleotide diphosphorylase [Legionella pneumophila]
MNNVLSQVTFDVKRALQEDVGNGDVTAALLPQQLIVEAEIISREPMLVCGQPWVNEVFKQVDN